MESLGDILRKRKIERGRSKEDIISDIEVCPICKGAGFYYPAVPFGHPDFGKALPCSCVQKKYQETQRSRLLKYSKLGPLVEKIFDNFSLKDKPPSITSAYNSALSFAKEPKGWLVLIGPSGCGKTHLLAAIANYIISQGKPALFVSVPDLIDHLRSTFSPTSEISYDELFHQVRDASLLLLDNFEPQSATPWAKEKLLQIIDFRYNFRLPTVFASRTPLGDMEETLRTRLGDPSLSKVIKMEEKIVGRGIMDLSQLKDMTFEKWDKRINLSAEERENLEKAFELAWEFAQNPEGWLVFSGKTGCGKTHLAASIAHYRLERNQPVLFISVPDFLDYLRFLVSEGKEKTEQFYKLFEAVKQSPLLILDDLGEQSSSPWAWEKIYQILSYRHNTRLPIVITTRLSLEQLEESQPPIMSRLADYSLSVFFEIKAPGYRIDHLRPRRRKER